MGWGKLWGPKRCLLPGLCPLSFPWQGWWHTDEVQAPSLDLGSVGEGESVGSGAPAGFQGSLSPPSSPCHGAGPEVAQRQWGHLGDPMADGHGVCGWSRTVEGGCSPGEVVRCCPLSFKLDFPCDSLGTLEPYWMGSSSTCFGHYQHRGWHENTVVNMQPV